MGGHRERSAPGWFCSFVQRSIMPPSCVVWMGDPRLFLAAMIAALILIAMCSGKPTVVAFSMVLVESWYPAMVLMQPASIAMSFLWGAGAFGQPPKVDRLRILDFGVDSSRLL